MSSYAGKELNLARLEAFVEALREVSQREELAEVDMASAESFSKDRPGCHAALAGEALNLLGVPPRQVKYLRYSFQAEGARLGDFLFDEPPTSSPLSAYYRDGGYDLLTEWAYTNPDDWGNPHGSGMFCSEEAFGQVDERFPSSVIADHWAEVLQRCREETQQ